MFHFSYLLTYIIPADITHILNPIAELVISIRLSNKEAKAEMGTHSVIVEIVQNFTNFFMLFTH